MTVCMEYPAKRPYEDELENAAGRGQEIHAGRTAHPISTGQNGQLMWWMTQSVIHQKHLLRYSSFNVFKLNTLILSMLRLTSTWHFVKPRWNLVSAAFQYLPNYRNTVTLWWVTKTVTHHLEVVNRQIVHLPPSHNAQILVGDHFDHQPDNRNALLCESGGSHFGNHHISVTAKGGCLWQQNNGNVKIRTPWWNISLTVTPVCTESSVNAAARSSTPRPGTANIAASRPAVTGCWTCEKVLKSALSAEPTPALAVVSSSCRFGRMPDIAATPVGRKTTVSVK